MTRRILALTFLATTAASGGTLAAQPLRAMERLTEGGRYHLMEINDKVVRLDTSTGAFDLCRMEAGQWNCRIAEDERAAMQARLDHLSERVARLEAARAADEAREAQASQANSKSFASRIYDYVPAIEW